MTYNLCLTIAGSDSGGEAGIQADLQCFQDFNCHGLSCITANTAQNPKKIFSLNPVFEETVRDQLTALFEFFEISYIKTGLLPNSKIMQCILDHIPKKASLICDPLIESTSGYRIMNEETLDYFQSTFIKRVDYLTPNLPEYHLLFGYDLSKEKIQKTHFDGLNFKGVFLKGGHSAKPGTDYIYDGRLLKLDAPEIEIKSSHGTGCRISSALCAALASGENFKKSSILAKNYVFHSLQSCKKTNKDQWLLSSPGNAYSLENNVTLSEME